MAKLERFDYDGFWKDLLERFFEPFLRLALPELHAAARLDREPRFLEAEFRDILQTSERDVHHPPSFVDYLIDVPLKVGGEQWVLLHIEVQGAGGSDLPARMDRYRCLITAHHSRYPAALALITDRRPKGEAERFERSVFGTTIRYDYNRMVLSDLDDEELRASDNPFALALYAAKCAARSKGQENRKFLYLKQLTQLLHERGWAVEDRRDLLLYIARILDMKNRDNWKEYHGFLKELEGGDPMSLPAFFDLYIDEEVRTRYREEGKAEGRAEGKAEGRAEGKAEGRLEGERLQAFATARKLLQMGLEVRNIAIATGLSIAEIESMK